MLDVFKIKPFDLEPVYASWTDAPVFNGDAKKDKPVDVWLDQIKDGCIERKVPEEYWYEVAQHYMGPAAKARLDAFKKVLYQVNGGTYRWTWKQFRAALTNMGWEIDAAATEAVEVKAKPFSSWFTVKRKKSKTMTEEPEEMDEDELPPPPPRKTPSRSKTAPAGISGSSSESAKPPGPSRAATLGFLPKRRDSRSSIASISSSDSTPEPKTVVKPELAKAMSDTVIETMKHLAPSKAKTIDSVAHDPNTEAIVTTIAHAPAWLVQASNAIEMLTKEHPKTMSALAAVLITAGSIPAMPVVAASPMAPILACHAAQAIGSIAVGLGTLLKASQNGQVQTTPGSSSSSSSK